MSNLLKSKFLVGIMLVAVLVVGGLAIATSTHAQQAVVSASDIQYAASVQLGSTGQSSLIWQKFLNDYSSANLVADGKFGPLSVAAAKIWQASRNVPAIGILGPMSRASAIAQIASGVTNPIGGTYPAGCSSFNGFSATTGLPCSSVTMFAPEGCTAASGFSPVTGGACYAVTSSTFPAGCTSAVGFSPTTGAKCDGGTVVSSTGEGTITLDYAAIPAASVVINKGQADQAAANIKIKATGSDMNVSRVWLDFTGYRPWLAANEASLFNGSTEIGRVALSASSFTEVTAGSKWQLQFNDLNLVVPVGTTTTLTFKLSRPMLTQSYGTLTIAATSSVRATDGAGFSEAVVMASRAISLPSTAATTGTLTTALNTNSPVAQSVSGLSTTAGVLTAVKLADFNFKGEDSAMNITQIVATLAATAGTVANEVASVELRDGTDILSSVALSTATATFPSLDINVSKDSTKVLSIWAQMNPIGTPGAGYTNKAAGITATLDSSATVATDSDWNTITVTSADPVGKTQYMFQYAPIFAMVNNATYPTDMVMVAGSTDADKGAAGHLSFSATAPNDRDIYLSIDATTGLLCGGTYEVVPIGNAACNSGTIGGTMTTAVTASGATSNGTGTTSGFAKIIAGSTRYFTISGNIPEGTAGFTGMTLATNGLYWVDANNVVLADEAVNQTWGLDDFKTGVVHVQT